MQKSIVAKKIGVPGTIKLFKFKFMNFFLKFENKKLIYKKGFVTEFGNLPDN